MPETVTVPWRGTGGQVYRFQLNPLGATYRARGGVYIFCRKDQDGRLQPVHIGVTDDFHRTLTTDLATHPRIACIRKAGATHLCTLYVPGPPAMWERIEADIRRVTLTPCNLP